MAAIALATGAVATLQAAEEPDLPKLLQTFTDELVKITPGEGKFPAELAIGETRVPLKTGFAIAKYEVPQNLFAAVMGENPSKWKGPRNSAEMMTWNEARQFCRKLTTLLRERQLIAANDEIRLPTEIEWEYCCRAGTTTAYSFGDAAQAAGDEGKKASVLDKYGWHTGNAAGNDPPVGALKPNPWGLYDVHGYLWEFCSDPWTESVSSNPAPADKTEPPEQIVVRGGSWKDLFDQLTSGSRRKFAVTGRDDAIGIRCVCAPIKN
ncbi:MAG: formylglycine-generating enzyme family protein [Planctomycetaceae bacterium]